MECIITYQKPNGEIFIRPYDFTQKKIGDETSMGWKVIEIHYKHDGNYYCYADFMRIFRYGFEDGLKAPRISRKKKMIKYLIYMLNKYNKSVN